MVVEAVEADHLPDSYSAVPKRSCAQDSASDIPADGHNGLNADSAAQCQHIRSVSVDRVKDVRRNVGGATLSEFREVLSLILTSAESNACLGTRCDRKMGDAGPEVAGVDEG